MAFVHVIVNTCKRHYVPNLMIGRGLAKYTTTPTSTSESNPMSTSTATTTLNIITVKSSNIASSTAHTSNPSNATSRFTSYLTTTAALETSTTPTAVPSTDAVSTSVLHESTTHIATASNPAVESGTASFLRGASSQPVLHSTATTPAASASTTTVSEHFRLSNPAIGGIAAGTTAVLAVIAGVIYYFLRRCKGRKSLSLMLEPSEVTVNGLGSSLNLMVIAGWRNSMVSHLLRERL
jgi:hypothetical protein